MLCRRLMVSLAKKRCFRFDTNVQASSIACGYIEKLNNSNNLAKLFTNSISCNEFKNRQYNLQVIKRFKSNKKRSKQQEEDEESDDEDDNVEPDRNTAVTTLKVNSLRLDLVLKAGLNIARNKVETAFYESNIRLNGKKVFKKSEQVNIGDEIDLIRGPSPTNPNFLLVSRVQILNVKENAENVSVKLSKNKSLVIENYDDAWKQSSS